MKHVIQQLVRDALAHAKNNGDLEMAKEPEIVIEKPKDPKLGDFSTNLAMTLAKPERKSPKVIAEVICKYLTNGSGQVEQVETAGPGFINLRMSRSFFLKRLLQVAESGEEFGRSTVGNGQKVLVEYVSANPTGPLHVGHGRGAAVGNTLSKILLKAGFDLKTEYYVNDVGNQMNILGRSTWLRYQEIYGKKVEFPGDHYQGDYIKDIAQGVIDQRGDEFLDQSEAEALPFFREVAAQWVLNGIKEDLKEFRVEFDQWFSEKTLYEGDAVDNALAWLKEKGFIYEKDGAVWLKSSAFQDDKDRVIVKQNGEQTYFCSDIAYHQNKVQRGYDKLVDLFGADHHGYVPRMQAVMQALGYDKEVFKALLVQFVSLKRGGEKVSMSTRSGEFVTLKEVVDEVGVDAARYFFLSRSCDSHLDFDLELAKKETPENPVFYIQYAHARICNVFLTAEKQGVAVPGFEEVDLSPLVEEGEFELIKKILAFSEVVEKSALSLEVHRISHYLHDLVAVFHSYYNKHRVVTEDKPLTEARLFLLFCLRITIRNGLSLMGISAPEKM
ncbi:MAG: arginine--tRNA ligase [Nitrospinaceae bacterium]|nr:MAG: arginine--tRNA ligase [Nitrospinaceae bacterium]